MNYKLAKDYISGQVTSVIKIDDDEKVYAIPFDPANTDYQEYLAWIAEGNTPEEAE